MARFVIVVGTCPVPCDAAEVVTLPDGGARINLFDAPSYRGQEAVAALLVDSPELAHQIAGALNRAGAPGQAQGSSRKSGAA